ncbi:MAG: hypothetical protein ACLQGP_37320 [Isosphaeraceae bacterium]
MIPPLVKGPSLRFPDQEITWAGECLWTGGYCFGTESGELLICRNDGRDELDVLPIKVSEEAVNDVAFWRDYVGVSTRSELTVARRSSLDDDLIPLLTTPDGAHGILATPGGRFFAPMGALGLLRVDPERIGGDDRITIDEPSQDIISFYKLIYLGGSSQDEVLACAARTSGLLLIESNGDKPLEIKGIVSKTVDFIDVCSVSSPRWPHAVVGLSLDRSLIFVRDLLSDETPQTLRLGELRGTPYSILSAAGRLFVLTSKELVAFPDLLNWYLRGESLDRPFRYRYIPIQAVDAYLAYGKHLIVVMDDEVRFFEIPGLAQPTGDHAHENGHGDLAGWREAEQLPNTIQPIWDNLSLVG